MKGKTRTGYHRDMLMMSTGSTRQRDRHAEDFRARPTNAPSLTGNSMSALAAVVREWPKQQVPLEIK